MNNPKLTRMSITEAFAKGIENVQDIYINNEGERIALHYVITSQDPDGWIKGNFYVFGRAMHREFPADYPVFIEV